MQSFVGASSAIYKSPRTKRVASPTIPSTCVCNAETHQPLSQHGASFPIIQICSCKRQRTSNHYPSLNARNLPASTTGSSNIQPGIPSQDFEVTEEMRKQNHEAPTLQHTTSDMIAMAATAQKSAQHSSQVSGSTALAQDEKIRDLRSHLKDDRTTTARDQTSAIVLAQAEEKDAFTDFGTEPNECHSVASSRLIRPEQRNFNNSYAGNSTIHNFYTRASILSPSGMVDVPRVQVDERSSFNLLPWLIVKNLNLIHYSDTSSTIIIGDRLIQTNKYCRMTIRVTGVDVTINTFVIPGLQIILLGKEWIQSVRLLNGFDNRSYYIPVPLVVEAAEERLPAIEDANIESQDVEMSLVDDTSESCNDEGYDNVSCLDDNLTNSELSFNRPKSDDETLLNDGPLPSSQVSPEENLTFDSHKSTPMKGVEKKNRDDEGNGTKQIDITEEGHNNDEDDEDDEDDKDDEDDEDDENGEDDKDDENGEDVEDSEDGEGDENIEDFENSEGDEDIEDYENDEDREDGEDGEGDEDDEVSEDEEDVQDDEDDTSAEDIDESAAPTSTTLGRDEVQTLFTKSQAKRVANILNNISRTQAGQNFKAPVERLWPECAEVYASKVLCPIDLGTMESKVNNDMYNSLDELKADAALLYENSLGFNGLHHIITTAALEVRDTILKAMSCIEDGQSSTMLRASIRRP